ncbi:hypothetical protein ECG_01743 [Echinococcus granulosus]|nr:hypothetical protein ECG_01743 [Echinococcus granulosus]
MEGSSGSSDPAISSSVTAKLDTISEIEACARQLDTEVTLLLTNLQSGLQRISTLTAGCLDLYSSLVLQTCDEMDANIKLIVQACTSLCITELSLVSMYAMMAKCEELTKAMAKVPQLQALLVTIRKSLARFESSLSR